MTPEGWLRYLLTQFVGIAFHGLLMGIFRALRYVCLRVSRVIDILIGRVDDK